MTKIILCGYSGNMGSAIRLLCKQNPENFEIVAGIGILEEKSDIPFKVFSKPQDCDVCADVIIDFSNPEITEALLEYAAQNKIPIVLCTTGLSEELELKIVEFSSKIAILRSLNMSLGINLLGTVLSKFASVLNSVGFDIEILEKHHNRKLDAPSGTALMLAKSINKELPTQLEPVFNRNANRQARQKNEIGIHSIRGGTIAGEHSVIFAGDDEVLELTHIAYTPTLFARGALIAANYIYQKPPGFYKMEDVLNKLVLENVLPN